MSSPRTSCRRSFSPSTGEAVPAAPAVSVSVSRWPNGSLPSTRVPSLSSPTPATAPALRSSSLPSRSLTNAPDAATPDLEPNHQPLSQPAGLPACCVDTRTFYFLGSRHPPDQRIPRQPAGHCYCRDHRRPLLPHAAVIGPPFDRKRRGIRPFSYLLDRPSRRLPVQYNPP